MHEGSIATTERRLTRRVRGTVLAAWCVLGVMGGTRAWGMASDGSLITNVVSATYGGSGGMTIRYAVSYLATANVLVSCPVVSLMKVPSVTVQSAGNTVTFQIWVANASVQASAFNVVITDEIPDNMVFGGMLAPWWNATPGPTGVTNAESANNVAWVNGTPPAGQPSPYYLRWTLDKLAPGRSGFVQYFATVL